jgi:hypothetical protein
MMVMDLSNDSSSDEWCQRGPRGENSATGRLEVSPIEAAATR